MNDEETRAFASAREWQGLVAAAILSCVLWGLLIKLAWSAAHLL